MNTPALNEAGETGFLYLNRNGRWQDFELHGLRVAESDGTLTLATVPRSLGEMSAAAQEGGQPSDGLGGIAIGPDGNVYFSTTARNRISKIDPCDRAVAPVPCISGDGHHPTRFIRPRGLMFHSKREALFVADSGNHCIQIFAIDSFQLIDIWGQPDLLAVPQPGSEDGLFNDPRSLAVDRAGNVYVLDYGNRRVQKFDLRGRVIPEFLHTIEIELERRNLQLQQPSEVAVNLRSESTEIYLLDQDSKSVFVFDEDGHYLEQLELNLQQPAGLAVKGDALYTGDWEQQVIFKFERNRLKRDTDKRDWIPIGEAQGVRGRTAALALTAKEDLWVHPGGDGIPLRLAEHGGYVKRGFLWGGPFDNPSVRRDQWHRLRATVARLSPGAHQQLFISSTSGGDSPLTPASPDVPPWSGLADELSICVTTPHNPGRWCSLPLDATECLFAGAPTDRVWIGCELISEGLTSPALLQMRLDFDHETYLQFLPAIYREHPQSARLLARFLTLFESLFADVETEIKELARLFDPRSVPAEFLSWLAGWLALEVAEKWDEGHKREAIAKAFELYAKRGTVEGLRESLRFFAGVEAHIEEPLAQANWWALAANEDSPAEHKQTSLLGITTMLVASEAQGAVVGTTAVLDRSHLIRQEEFGVPLFDDLAHRFSVQLYRGGAFGGETVETVRAVLDREKPAHTDYHLCVIEPNFRIGFQSRIGIDAVVAGPVPPTGLAPATSADAVLVLGGEPAGKIGQRSSIGETTRLGLRSFEVEHSERDCDSE
jgi:phage tail-like protein